jgi:hypothetical protein
MSVLEIISGHLLTMMFVCLNLSSIVEAMSPFKVTPNKIKKMVKPLENSGKLSMSTFLRWY